ncbi:MAG TPA: hypothetical protein VMU05_23995 [Dongiaceae bacterium]|nr:hypothetical protein [Dongiaceae bacterium]
MPATSILLYSQHHLGVLIYKDIMQRLTARFLLLLAMAGTILPVTLHARAVQHACCRRSAAHHCLDATNPRQPTFSDSGCCQQHGCFRAATTSHWAHPLPTAQAVATQPAAERATELNQIAAYSRPLASRSTRAPPQASLT